MNHDITIESLGLDTRARNILTRNQLLTVARIVSFVENGHDVAELRNCGAVTADRIYRAILDNTGISLHRPYKKRTRRYCYDGERVYLIGRDEDGAVRVILVTVTSADEGAYVAVDRKRRIWRFTDNDAARLVFKNRKDAEWAAERRVPRKRYGITEEANHENSNSRLSAE